MPASFFPTAFTPTLGQRLRFVLTHAILPLCVLALTAGTLLWGPYVGLGITAIAWRLVTRFA